MPTTAELAIKVESKDVTKAAKANEELAKSGEEVAKSTEKAAKAGGKAASSSKKAAAAAREARKAQNEQAATAQRLQKQYSGLQRQILAVGAAFLSFQAAREAIRVIADFGEATAIVRALGKAASATDAQLAALAKQSRELGKSTRFTATQATEAQAALIRGGLQAQEALAATASTLDLAIAGILSLERAAEITAITLNQFNLAASQSGRVADVLVKAASTSATNVEQLAQALKFVGPIAAGFGATLEETTAALQVLANAGLAATIGGTNLRGAYAALSKPTKQAANTIALLAKASGQSVEAFDVTKRSLAEVFEAFKKANAGPKELIQIFGRLQAPGALALTRAGKEVEDFTKKLEDSEGTAAKFREELQKELKDNLLALGSAVQELALVFNDRFGPSLIKAVQFLTEVVNALGASDEEAKKLTTTARNVAGAIKFLAAAAAIFAAVKLATAIGAAAQSLYAFVVALKVVRATLVTTGIGALIVGLGVLAGFALDAAGAFDTIDKNASKVAATGDKLAKQDRALEKSAREKANAQRIADEKALNDAQAQLDKEAELEEKREEAAKAAQDRARQIAAQARAAQDQLIVQEFEIRDRADLAGTSAATREFRRLQNEFDRTFAKANKIQLGPGDDFFAAIERQVKSEEDRIALNIKYGEELAKRSRQIAAAQAAEEQAAREAKAEQTVLGIAEAYAEALEAKNAFGREGLDLVQAETLAEFGNLSDIAEGLPDQLSGARAELEKLAAVRFGNTLNEQLAETVMLMRDLESTQERSAEAFDQYAEAAALTVKTLEQLRGLPGASASEIAELDRQIQEVSRSVNQFAAETARAEGFQQLSDAVTIITRSFFDLFNALVTGSGEAREAFASFIQSVTQALFQKFVVEQVLGAISKGFSAAGVAGVASANGNAFRSGEVVPFANGGILSGPTVFPLGLAGEAGPEAIMPLQRGPDGRLGVAAHGGGSQAGSNPFMLRSMSPGASQAPTQQESMRGLSRTTNVQFNVATRDASSFRKSSRQITDLALGSIRV